MIYQEIRDRIAALRRVKKGAKKVIADQTEIIQAIAGLRAFRSFYTFSTWRIIVFAY